MELTFFCEDKSAAQTWICPKLASNSNTAFQKSTPLKRCDTSLEKEKSTKSTKDDSLGHMPWGCVSSLSIFSLPSLSCTGIYRRKTSERLVSWWATSTSKWTTPLILKDLIFRCAGSQPPPLINRIQGNPNEWTYIVCFPACLKVREEIFKPETSRDVFLISSIDLQR